VSVYVDGLFTATPQGDTAHARQARSHGNRWCHMTADSLEELHAMADRIGLKREWFQVAARLHMCHYDLVPSKRALAVKAGAVEVNGVAHMRQLHADGRAKLLAVADPDTLAASLYGVELDG